jgi:hypothetical protein
MPAAKWETELAHELCKDALAHLAKRYAEFSDADKAQPASLISFGDKQTKSWKLKRCSSPKRFPTGLAWTSTWPNGRLDCVPSA